MSEKILVVDDEEEIVAFIRDALTDEGYQVWTAGNGENAIAAAKKQPDLIILDIMLPGCDGYAVCRAIRDEVSCPVIFLSARQGEDDRVRGLATGGDDYMVKPFSLRELKARISAHLRRERRSMDRRSRSVLRFDGLTLDLKGHTVCWQEKNIPVTNREFAIMEFLALHPEQVFSREQIYERVWGLEAAGDSSTVTEHVKKIRAKLAAAGCPAPDGYLATVWGAGYKWRRQR
ncbi:response regulator transcription factor [Desulfotomaculum copahuensis]|uniref:Stage 0 sporulation protein A homolog n=1 Tax=Desulfotomaculum copahuensis TaxID=1838280 RepID=A0A1B7LKN1_9FIRM|nr:response regulator transcription factor [Desulfotomaculum copahuensis]OAT87127.1 DNA-binding response regulator [Desulfotomaculum copahuensis]